MIRKSQEFLFEDIPQPVTLFDIVTSQQECNRLSRRLGIEVDAPSVFDPEHTLQSIIELVAIGIAQQLLRRQATHPTEASQQSVVSISLSRKEQEIDGVLTFRIIGQQSETFSVNICFMDKQPVATF